MRVIKIAVAVLSFSVLSSCDVVQSALEQSGGSLGNLPLTQDEVVRGLKNALTVGTDSAVCRLNATDGFLRDAAIKVLLPPEAQNIMNYVGKIPGGQALVDKTITALNRAAEDAAGTAAPIFSDAVKKMTIQDAFGILRGAETAATDYLKTNTYSQLQAAFKPKIQTSLGKPLIYNTSAEKLYTDLVSAYNLASLGGTLFPKITGNSLTDHVTARALDGVFLKIANEEKLIRQDPAHRVTSILERVFGSKQ
ncbi:MAG: DUF4197 domain-containing protein [Bacteroidetes bacterium]|nr:MAG: DUF4197 domain-containing protein [Bacteroidota bacterium]